jgi:dephospho-CoA kinase
MLVIGLTGGIGSGKSTVAKEFLKLGIYIVDADKKARDAVALGKPALGEISEHFGSGILAPDGNLDRAKLRSLIFSAHEEKEWLEQLLHPLIRQDIEADLKSATSPYAILESPLLFETNQHQMTDKTLLIDVPIEIQVTRSCQRDNNTETQIRKIIETQMPRTQKQDRADFVLDNTISQSELNNKVGQLHKVFLSL